MLPILEDTTPHTVLQAKTFDVQPAAGQRAASINLSPLSVFPQERAAAFFPIRRQM